MIDDSLLERSDVKNEYLELLILLKSRWFILRHDDTF